jgi:hypothetical protein
MIKRVILAGAALLLGGAFVLVSAGPAGAVIDQGPCNGSGQFVNEGLNVRASESGVVEVPEKDTVNWEGALGASTDEVPYSGKIEVELPPPFAALSIDDWSGTTDSVQNNGTKKYDIPSFVPKGVELDVVGEHTQGSIKCKGHVTIKLAGSTFGPVSIVSLVGTAATGVGLVLAGRPRVGR